MSAQGKPVERKKPTPEEERLAELRGWFNEALEKNPPTPELKGLHDTAERAAAETREQLAAKGKPKEPASWDDELKQMVGEAFDTAERRAIREYEEGVRGTGEFHTAELEAIRRYREVMRQAGKREPLPQPEAPVEKPPGGGGLKTPTAKHEGEGKGRGILAGLGIAAAVILTTLGVNHMLNKPPAKTLAQNTSISSSTSSTTIRATPTTTTIPPAIEDGGKVEKIPRPETPKGKLPDLQVKADNIVKSAKGLPFEDALLTLKRYALSSGGSEESKKIFFDGMQELVDTYKECKKDRNQKNFDACRNAMRNLGARWTTISTEEVWRAGGVPGTDSQIQPMSREPNQTPNAVILRDIKPHIDALGKKGE